MKGSDEIRKVIEDEECACVLIDDSGSRGQVLNIPNRPDESYSWVGVVVPPTMGRYVFDKMDRLLDELRTKYGYNVDELHFVDIYAGNCAWKNVDFDERMNIFRMFSNIVVKDNFYLFNRTLYKNNEMFELARKIFPDFAGKDMNDPNICALSLLLVRIKMFLEGMGWKNSIVLVDEDIQKPGSFMVEKSLSPFIKNGEIHFCCSKDVAPLQIADFAAYSLHRSQVILGRMENNKLKSNTDKKFLKAVQPIANIYENVFIRLVNTDPLRDIKDMISKGGAT